MRLSGVFLVLFVTASSVHARNPGIIAQGSADVTYNDNITLSRDDVNFGPGVLASSDLLGALRVRAGVKNDHTQVLYSGSRTHFFKNTDLGYLENTLQIDHDEALGKLAVLRMQGLISKVDPDLRVTADTTGRFPFTTSEPPDRQILQLIFATPKGRTTDGYVRVLAQGQQYTNDPLLDNRATAVQLHVGRPLDDKKKWGVAAEAQAVARDYTNILGPVPSTIVVTHAPNAALHLSYIPNQHFGFLLKHLWIDQTANTDAFFLGQRDLSLAATWLGDSFGSASLIVQYSHRDFSRRLLSPGVTQLDRDLLMLLTVTKRLTPRDNLTLSYTNDRNRSNSADFDYSNNVVRLGASHSF